MILFSMRSTANVLNDKDIKAKIFNSVRNVNLNQCIAWKKGNEVHNFLDEY